jgi:hypothetical protein
MSDELERLIAVVGDLQRDFAALQKRIDVMDPGVRAALHRHDREIAKIRDAVNDHTQRFREQLLAGIDVDATVQ